MRVNARENASGPWPAAGRAAGCAGRTERRGRRRPTRRRSEKMKTWEGLRGTAPGKGRRAWAWSAPASEEEEK